jgi:hypothetical protein
MRWTPRGVHLLLQVRTRVLNGQLARRLPPLVPRPQPGAGPRGTRGVASPNLFRSRGRALDRGDYMTT